MGHSPQPLLQTRLLMYKPWVPRRLRFWLIVMFALFYQLTGGVYLAALSQMVGELAYIGEDVTMASYCSLIGLNMIFPVLFRWKFYMYTRQMFFVSSIGALLCAAAAMVVTVPWVFWLICLFAGYFKMMGMFACMSTIQLNISPSRDFGVFFPVVYILVCGAIQLSGIMTAYITYEYDWHMVYAVVIGMMLVIDGIVYFMMKPDHRSAPFIPLKGIDWTGHALWVALCCVAAWIFNFGEHYDWWGSYPVWYATWIFLALLVATLVESYYKPEPFISLQAFRHPMVWNLCFLLFGMALLQSSAHVLQPVLMNAVGGYDYFTIVNFNYPELFGVIMGAILAYFSIIRLKWSMKSFFFTCFLLSTFYIVGFYFLIDPSTEAPMYYLPLFALGAAEVMMETGVTYVLSRSIPFPHFFMSITIVGFVRCGVGTSAAGAIVERMFAWSLDKAVAATPHPVEIAGFQTVSGDWVSGYYAVQHLMVALKECFGYLALAGIFMMVVVLLSNYRHTIARVLRMDYSLSRVAFRLRRAETMPDVE